MKQASTQAIMLLLLLLQVVMVMLTFTAAVPVRQQPRPRSSNSDRPNFVVIFADGELLPSFLYFFFQAHHHLGSPWFDCFTMNRFPPPIPPLC